MPAREVRDELQATEEPVADEPALRLPPIQIKADKPLQTTLVDVVKDDYETMLGDRDKRDYGQTSKGEALKFDDWYKRLKDIYTGEREAKTVPWKFCSNRSLKIAASILQMIHARLFPAVWNEDTVRWRPGDITDVPKVERINRLMDWWIRVWSPMREFFDNWVKYVSAFGDELMEASWSVEERLTDEMNETPMMDELGQPLINQDGTPAVKQVPRVDRIEKTTYRILAKESVFLMDNAKDIQKDPIVIKEKVLFKDLEDLERRGACINVTTELEKLIVVSVPQGIEDPAEKERIRRIKLRNEEVEILTWWGHYDVDGTGLQDSVRIITAYDHRIYLGGVRVRHLTKSGNRPLVFQKFDSKIDKPEHLIGDGLIEQVRELAEEIDAIFNQLTDANTLMVMRPGFYDPSGNVDAPVIELAPNKLIPVSDPQRNIYYPDIRIPIEQLILAIRLVLEFVERLTAASSYVMGRESEIVGGSGTATRTQAIMQSADIRFAIPAERLRAGATRVLQVVLDILQLNIPPGLETRVLGEKGEQVFHAGELTDSGISGKFDAYMLEDAAMGSKQTERELAGLLYNILLMNPIVASDPVKIYTITADLIKANRKEPEHYLGPAPMQDDIDDPEDENTLMIQGEFKRVRAQLQENHIYHIQKHIDLSNSPALQQLAQEAPHLVKEITDYNQAHIQEHMVMLQSILQMMAQAKGGGGGGGVNTATNPASKRPNEAPRMENQPGPMGKALDTQRKGEVGST